MAGKQTNLDKHQRLGLTRLDSQTFEQFFLHFLNAGISLTVERHGKRITRRVISAETFAAGSGRRQKGIDLRAAVEGEDGKEVWAFQCKHHKKWDPAQTREAIHEAHKFQANHYFLVVACDPHQDVQETIDEELKKYPNWTFWNLDQICAEFRLQVHPSKHAQVLFFLSPEELKRFVPFTTDSLIAPETFFAPFLGDKTFRHDWPMVGRQSELQSLRDFLASPHKVQILSAKGGEGKSRLLWEFCRTLQTESPETQILCVNPHRGEDDFTFSFSGHPPSRVILVDDAHRTEQVPLQLLSQVFQDKTAKIILASRPQALGALSDKLVNTGLANSVSTAIAISSLKKSEMKALATEALGEAKAEHASALIGMTKDSPFLTVMAGELLRNEKLTWGNWTSDEEFRQHVFREFEKENFEMMAEDSREFAGDLIRLLALLAPVAHTPQFAETAARCLGCSVSKLETYLLRLRESELLVGRQDGLRIVPDLFADFLVYETCYEAKTKKPGFVQQILREFSDSSPALLRNLSEANWLAQANGMADNAILQPIVAAEFSRFKGSSFFERARMLEEWTHFGVYLPAESLTLAQLALSLDTAPQPDEGSRPFRLSEMDSHAYVCRKIPALLKPIATYHDDYRRETLDLLWNLGVKTPWTRINNNQEHPFSVIAEIIKYEPKKSVEVIVSTLAWLENRMQQPGALTVLEDANPILRTLLAPCFERFVEFTQFEGNTVQLWQHEVSIPNTQVIRNKALGILRYVIEQSSWRAALDAFSALENAMRRVAPIDTSQADNEKKFISDWRPERLKALAVCELAIFKHANVAVRYEIRQTLKLDLTFEEDAIFAKECRRVLNLIANDLALRVTVAVLSDGTYEFEEEIGVPESSEDHKKVQELWNARLRETAVEVCSAYPHTTALHIFLKQLTEELIAAGNNPSFGGLFWKLAQINPALAIELAQLLISSDSAPSLTAAWPLLLEENQTLESGQRMTLFEQAARSPRQIVRTAFIQALLGRVLKSEVLDSRMQSWLLEIAGKATFDDALAILQLVKWSSDANASLAFTILEKLPLSEIVKRSLEPILEALVPYTERKTLPPKAVVQHVLGQLVFARNFDIHEHRREWEVLSKAYPREIYEWVRTRIAHSESGTTESGYYPIPRDYESTFKLPELAKEPDFPAICADLWQKVSRADTNQRYLWEQLFQAVVLEHPSFWLSHLLAKIAATSDQENLLGLTQLIRFQGSMIIFHFPEVTRSFLKRANELGGDSLHKKMQSSLYHGCGPQGRSYSGGILDPKDDYVEAAAAKAAEAHASDELLGPFFRWIVETEQQDRLIHRMRAEADMASLD